MRRELSLSLLSILLATGSAARAQVSAQAVAVPSPAAAPSPTATVSVSGRVRMSDGSAATHARAYFSWLGSDFKPHFLPVPVDSQGRFQCAMTLNPDSLQPVGAVSVIAFDQPILWREIELTKKPISLDLTMQKGAAITGKMIRLDGSPAANVDIQIDSLKPPAKLPRSADPTAMQNEVARFQWRQLAKYAPASAMKGLYSACTNSQGRFQITNLPKRALTILKPSGEFKLAPGSATPAEIGQADQTDVGTFVIAGPGTIHVRVLDHASGKPVSRASVSAFPASIGLQSFTGFGMDSFNQKPVRTDASGLGRITGLVPGKYFVFAGLPEEANPQNAAMRSSGMVFAGFGSRTVTVSEGQTADVTSHIGIFKGHVTDSSGKPIAESSITIETPGAQGPFGAFAGFSGQGTTPAAKTDVKGEYNIADFPWDSEKVIVRATRSNDQVEWTGPGTSADRAQRLRLRKGALVGISGRLVDTNRKPIGKAKASLIRWQDGPRITWFASAQSVEAGADGRFHLDGLLRGEAFTLIGGSPFGGMAQQDGKPQQGFESPRFTSSTTGSLQDLGDVVVHPLEGPQQVLQLYGLDSPGQLAHLSSLSPVPTAEMVAGAKVALDRYKAALRAGDLDSVHKLTSRSSFGWSEDRAQFLLNTSLRADTATDLNSATLLRLVPRISTAYLTALNNLGSDGNAIFNLGAAARKAEAEPNWVFLVQLRDNAVKVVGAAHKEQGEWRVVTLPDVQGQDIVLLTSGATNLPDPAMLDKPAILPQPDQRALALAAGRTYLAAWANENDAARLALTSPLPFGHALVLADIRKLKSSRADEDVCAAAADSLPELKTVEDLTQWELAWLANYAITLTEFSGNSRARGGEMLKGFPAESARKGEIMPFRYTADGREFLMLLLRREGKWQVLEPALPVS